MSEIIRLLPPSVANQIAAGEVIQRPASVVKELVENAIDAGASQIKVLLEDAGRTLIQVIDNGKGMSGSDAVLCFERHATSKIQDASDLFSLKTMGFRGEALASIAAVAEVELKTQQEEDALGTRVMFSASQKTLQEPCQTARGCNFLVRNLFFNVPARRKFLKSNATELSNAITEFQRIALVYPDKEFHLFSNASEVLNLPVSSRKGRISGIFGKKLQEQLLPLDVQTSLVNLSGFVGKPESSHKKGLHQYFFVNGRYMRHPYFNKAVAQAFEGLVPQGEQVHYFIYFDVDPSTIDVNIHPTKTEIKFENEQAIWKILLSAIRESLGRFSAVPMLDFDAQDRPEDMPVFRAQTNVSQPKVHVDASFNPFQTKATADYDSREGYRSSSLSGVKAWDTLYEGLDKTTGEPFDSGVKDAAFDVDPDPSWNQTCNRQAASDPVMDLQIEEKAGLSPSSGLFQLRGRFIVMPSQEGLLVVDQHRAHINVLFERYMAYFSKGGGCSQGLLFPQVVELAPSRAAILDDIMDDVQAVGFDLSNLGSGSYAIQGVPPGLEQVDHAQLLEDMISSVLEGSGQAKEGIQRRMALVMARRSAICYGQVLSTKEMADLLERLFQMTSPGFTPDGLPVMQTIEDAYLEKLFSR